MLVSSIRLNKKNCFICALTVIVLYPKLYQGVSVSDCRASMYGCCPDGITPAEGPLLENCYSKNDNFDFDESCEISEYGCCSDDYTPAKGPAKEGCIDYSCRESEYGCCNDLVTPAKSPDLNGCPTDCTQSLYGCCSDGKTVARGTGHAGCENQEGDCSVTEFGCCDDGVTVALNPSKENCPDNDPKFDLQITNLKTESKKIKTNSSSKACSNTEFECCPDGVTPAAGPGFKDCIEDGTHLDIKYLKNDENICILPEPGKNCYNYSLKWRYDTNEGRCLQFWYGGCDANQNLFNTNIECEAKCVNPNGTDICKLPLVNPTKQCFQNVTRYYYDISTLTCKMFSYSGCYGNANNFETIEECERRCKIPLVFEHCSFIPDKGPCRGDHERWYFDSKVGRCKTFSYGGCMKNKNNHYTESDCIDVCVKPKQKNVCLLPKIVGNCEGKITQWYYDFIENKCKQMLYSGCNGNLNRFETLEACEYTCQGLNEDYPKQTMISEICDAPKISGLCHLDLQRWYYNSTTMMCHQFTYSGCDSNSNNFESEIDCRATCNAKKIDPCELPMDHGTCDRYKIYWYYNQVDKECVRFYYGGCDGNQNRFETKEMCEMDCKMTKEEKLALLKLPKQCLEPMEYGSNCGELMPKWYFDTQSKVCYAFEYSGCGPDFSNRFDSSDECNQMCVENLKINTDETALQKSSTSPISTKLIYDLCELPVAKGNCSQRVTKWYYDSKLKHCKQFEFTGCNGNENRFETRDQCTEICEISKRKEICNSNKAQGPCNQYQIRWYLDTETRTCREFQYGGCLGNDNNFMSLMECRNFCWDHLSDEAKNFSNSTLNNGPIFTIAVSTTNYDVCSLKLDEGDCSNFTDRWYYDVEVHECKKFTYKGCNGNGNNFENKEKCNLKCGHNFLDLSSTDYQSPCESPTDIAVECLNDVTLEILPSKIDMYHNNLVWYYDIEIRSCKAIAGECINFDNPNRFKSYHECTSQCIPNVNEKQSEADCLLPFDTGNKCNLQIWRWYYDASSGQCNLFSYSGCHGNNNNFPTSKDCLWLCASVGGNGCPSLDECSLDCKYGRVISLSNCELCECNDPCQDVKCESEQSCVVENMVPVCRNRKKPGICTDQTLLNNTSCTNSCKNDADCPLDHKCCINSCSSYQCIPPNLDTDPVILEFKDYVELKPGGTLVLPCKVSGYPLPTVTWFKNHEEISVDPYNPRLYFTKDNTLILNNVTHKDETVYSCRASNIRGKAVVKESRLILIVPPQILHGSYEKFAIFGTDVVLNCNVSGRPMPKVKWIFKNSLIKSDPFKYVIYPNMLLIKRFEYIDVGLYTCQIFNHLNESSSIEVDLKRAIPGEVKFSFMTTYGDVNLSVVLKCNFTGSPQPNITWQTPTYQQINQNSEKYEIINQTDLKINSLKFDDSGIYRCYAINQFSLSQMKKKYGSILLNVYSPPIISTKSEKFVSNVNSTLILNCITNGIPKPEINWYKEDKLIVKNQLIIKDPNMPSKYKFSTRNGSLTILDLVNEDSGFYYCFASSLDRFPVASLNHSVKVLGNKYLINKTFTINEIENEIIKISCNIYPDDKKLMHIIWTFNDSSKLDQNFNPKKYSFENQNTLLIIKNSEINDSGTYECLAETEANNYITRNNLIVSVNNYKSAKIDSRKKELKAEKDKSILLDCAWWYTNSDNLLFDSNLKNPIEWRLNNTIINEYTNLKKYEFLDSYNTLLKINSLEMNETYDTYTCDFKLNENEIKQSIFSLKIGVVPYVSGTIQPLKWYEEFDTINLECPIDGMPKPVKSWYLNSNLIKIESNSFYRIDSETFNLQIKKLENSLQGTYTCNGTNDFGTELIKYNIEIPYPMQMRETTDKVIKVRKSDNVVIKCDYSNGKPEPTVNWLFNGNSIDFLYNRKYSLDSNILTIKNVQKEDSGIYTCVLSNGYHKTQTNNFTLNILDQIAIKFLPDNPIFTVGTQAKLTCLTESGVTVNQINWFKNGVKLTNIKKYKFDGTSIIIDNISVDDAGKYSCRIGAKDSNTTKSINVKVIDQNVKIDCEDKSSYNDCKLVVSKGLCSKWGKFCCRTCRQAGYNLNLN